MTSALCVEPMVAPAARLEIQYATGTVRTWGERINLSTTEHALIFAIARHRYASTRDQLIDLVWGDTASGKQTHNAFNIALHRLRRRLGGPDAVVHTSLGYALCDEAVVDLEYLEALARLTRRSALNDHELELLRHVCETWGLAANVGQDTYDWLEATNYRVQALLAEVRVAFGRNVLQRGDVNKALEIANDLLDADGCDEHAAKLMITALLERGDRSEAIRIYRHYSNALLSELGLRPSPGVIALLDSRPK
jgi:DNA-binding SARP family transcriptional activator